MISLDQIRPIILKLVEPEFILHFNSEPWGDTICIMEKSGLAFCRIYWHYGDNSIMFSDLSVDANIRKEGLGQTLLNIADEIAQTLLAESISLWVKKESWMQSWYERNGYVVFKQHDEDPEAIWMVKSLI